MSFHAVIVPGGGVLDSGELPAWVAARFDVAIARQQAGPFLALSGGTPHKPAPVFEAFAGARYLLHCGIPASRIYTEISSYDTIGNAFFARVQHTDVRGWTRLLIVNNAFHMPRTEAVFRWLFALAPERPYDLAFATAPDTGMPGDLRAARLARESVSLGRFREMADRFRTLAELHAWLYAEHGAYQAESATPPRPVDPHLARLY